MDSPVGRLAVTLELSFEMETCGVGMVGETGMAEGFLERSMLGERRSKLTGLYLVRTLCKEKWWRECEAKSRN